MRGIKSVKLFAQEMLATLNTPKNSKKTGWENMSLTELRIKLYEERREVDLELDIIAAGDSEAWTRLASECVDEANVLMMLRERAVSEVVRMMAEVRQKGAE